MTHREVLEALSGLLLAMFVAMLSSTVVSNALPAIVTDLEGSQTGYTWVVVATLLTMTATTPIWGKLADLFSKKVLVQSALVIFSIGSLVAGFAPAHGGADRRPRVPGPRRRRPDRAGAGRHRHAWSAPRERGRYSGYIGATFAARHRQRPAHRRPASSTRRPRLALVLLRRPAGRGARVRRAPEDAAPAGRTPRGAHRLPRRHAARRRRLAAAGLGLARRQPVRLDLVPPASRWSPLGLAVLAAALFVEAQVAREPIIPLRLFRDRTTSLATAASVLDRRRDVRRRPSTSASTSSSPAG